MSVAKLGPEQHSCKTKQETGGEYGIIGENMWPHSSSSDRKSWKCNKCRRCWGANGPVVHHRWAHCLVSAQSLDPRRLVFPFFSLGEIRDVLLKPSTSTSLYAEERNSHNHRIQKQAKKLRFTLLNYAKLGKNVYEVCGADNEFQAASFGWTDRHQSFIWEEPDRLSRLCSIFGLEWGTLLVHLHHKVTFYHFSLRFGLNICLSTHCVMQFQFFPIPFLMQRLTIKALINMSARIGRL